MSKKTHNKLKMKFLNQMNEIEVNLKVLSNGSALLPLTNKPNAVHEKWDLITHMIRRGRRKRISSLKVRIAVTNWSYYDRLRTGAFCQFAGCNENKAHVWRLYASREFLWPKKRPILGLLSFVEFPINPRWLRKVLCLKRRCRDWYSHGSPFF